MRGGEIDTASIGILGHVKKLAGGPGYAQNTIHLDVPFSRCHAERTRGQKDGGGDFERVRHEIKAGTNARAQNRSRSRGEKLELPIRLDLVGDALSAGQQRKSQGKRSACRQSSVRYSQNAARDFPADGLVT